MKWTTSEKQMENEFKWEYRTKALFVAVVVFSFGFLAGGALFAEAVFHATKEIYCP